MRESRVKELPIEGMTCSHCEKAVQKALLGVAGVTAAEVDYKSGIARVTYHGELDPDQLEQAVRTAGYEIPSKGAALKPVQMAGLLIALALIFMLIQHTVGFNFIPELQPSMGYSMLFFVGLLTSLHCIAMCGGINLSQCLVQIDGQSSGGAPSGWQPSLLYNSGRVVSYTLLGGIVGALGSVMSLSGHLRGLIAILAGLFMVVMGINLLGVMPSLSRFQPALPRGLRTRLMGADGRRGPFVVGLLNGLMPCGPLQAMQLYALGTGSASVGALSMLFFSLGTVPLMFGFGAVSTLLSKRFTRAMLKGSAVLVIVLGLVMMQRGFSLNGQPALSLPSLMPPVAVEPANTDVNISPEGKATISADGKFQTVTVEVGPSQYPEITVQKGLPVRFNLHANKENLNGCNRAVLIPDFNVRKGLEPGDNIIEFTPGESGTYGYTCWMGMISSQITVVDKISP